MQIKTTLKFLLTPVRMANVKAKITGNAGLQAGKAEHLFILVGAQVGAATMGTSVAVSLKS